ncbi:MAG: NAD(P)H-dependent oxidoreductase subunit E [Anaerolineales bacterium]|nr:NAD(P)H-dependent oxidoreductase subunit E [Anaerolineales bacterium]
MTTKTHVFDRETLNAIVDGQSESGRTALIPALLEAQRAFGYLSEELVEQIGQDLRVPLAEIHGVIEFYSMLYRRPVGETIIRVCTSPMCAMVGGEEACTAACDHLGVERDVPSQDGRFMVEAVECLGLCDHAPAALVGDTPVAGIDPREPASWIASPEEAPPGVVDGDLRWLTARCGVIDPTDLAAYERLGGFQALKDAIKDLQPEDVVETIKKSGLVGRGGAAFPTGLKWEYTAAAPGETRYIVCNADESEPGTFKDRALMEGDPFSVIEGILLAGYAIGAKSGYLYIRGEYPRARRILSEAIGRVRDAGYLGENILGTGFTFDLEIRSGVGAYICGEETALFESIEGKRGFPRLKPPFPTTHGLFGKPTAINNVETLCTATWILANGVKAYRAKGTEKSPGSKLFCLSGDVERPGVYEVAFGVQLQELIDMAGGVTGDLQAVLLGGAAGAFATPAELHLPMTFEDLQAAGLSLGSGVVTVINQERDLMQFLVSLAHFFAHESCGKCFPCQLGTQRQLEIVGRFAEGEAKKGDREALDDVGFAMTNASLCGLGMTAGTAILSAVKKWPELMAD